MEDNTNSLDKAAKEYVRAWTDAMTQMWGNWMNLVGLVEPPQQSPVRPDIQPQSTDSPTIATEENTPLQPPKNLSQQSHHSVPDSSVTEAPTTNHLQAFSQQLTDKEPTTNEQPPFPLHLKDKDSIVQDLKNQLAIQQETVERQTETIARLEQQLAEMQSVASIGSWQLNKWRARTF